MAARSFSIAAASPKPLMTTLAPSLAKARAIARPMPLVEPVTMALRAFKVMGSFRLGSQRGTQRDLRGIAYVSMRKNDRSPLHAAVFDARQGEGSDSDAYQIGRN